MAICMQDDSAVLYALLRLRGEAKVLKLEKKKASMKCLSWLLMGFGNKSYYKVIVYICSGGRVWFRAILHCLIWKKCFISLLIYS